MSSTGFVVEGGKTAAQSFQPCHLFGDGDIYGIGVRISFYIQYAAAIVALIADSDNDITQATLGLTLVSAAVFVNLCVNSTGTNLVYMDWQIIITLILFFVPIYAFWRPIHWLRIARRAGLMERFYNSLETEAAERVVESYHLVLLEESRLEQQFSATVIPAGFLVEYHQLLTTFYELAAVESPLTRQPEHQELERLIPPDVLEEALYHRLYQADAEREQSPGSWFSIEYIRATTSFYANALRSRGPWFLFQKIMLDSFARECISIGCVLLIWSAYICAGPWLAYKAIYRGQKAGCNVKTMDVWFVPLSIYNRGHIIWLRVAAVIAMFSAAGFVLFAIIVFIIGFKYKSDEMKDARQLRINRSMRSNSTEELASPKIKIEEKDPLRKLKLQRGLEVFQSLEISRKFYFRKVGGSVLSLFALFAILVVELTVNYVNLIDFDSDILNPSQFYPLLLSLFTAVPVVYNAINALIWRKELKDAREEEFQSAFKVYLRKQEKDWQKEEARNARYLDDADPSQLRAAEEGQVENDRIKEV